jgi:hypothetical protein
MAFGGKLRGSITTRYGVFIGGMKTHFEVDPGLQDTIVPIANAQISALAPRNVSAIYISYHNTQPQMLPDSLRYLEQNQGGGAGLLPGGIGRRVLPFLDGQ